MFKCEQQSQSLFITCIKSINQSVNVMYSNELESCSKIASTQTQNTNADTKHKHKHKDYSCPLCVSLYLSVSCLSLSSATIGERI